MSQDALMQRMIAAGVDILNPQAVFDFYHKQNSEGSGNIDLNQFKTLVDQWIAAAISGKASQQDLDGLAEQKADKTELDLKASNTALEIKVNRDELTVYALKDDLISKANQQDLADLDAQKANKNDVNQQLSGKLNSSDYHQHFRGLFSSPEALAQQVLNPIAGDYANVDAGVGNPTKIYAYDVDDGIWQLQGSSGFTVSSSDSIPEGNNNLYFNSYRVEAVVRGMNTGDLPEGTNLYFTPARVQTVVRGMNTGDLPEGTNLYFTPARVQTVVRGMNTGDLPEGTNLYFTTARVNALLAPITAQIGEIDQLLTQVLGG